MQLMFTLSEYDLKYSIKDEKGHELSQEERDASQHVSQAQVASDLGGAQNHNQPLADGRANLD